MTDMGIQYVLWLSFLAFLWTILAAAAALEATSTHCIFLHYSTVIITLIFTISVAK